MGFVGNSLWCGLLDNRVMALTRLCGRWWIISVRWWANVTWYEFVGVCRICICEITRVN